MPAARSKGNSKLLVLLGVFAFSCLPASSAQLAGRSKDSLSQSVSVALETGSGYNPGKHLSPRDARHLLSRFTFGVRRSDVESAVKVGALDWLEWQMQPDSIDDSVSEHALEALSDALAPPDQLAALYAKRPTASLAKGDVGQATKRGVRMAKLLEDTQAVQFVRQILSSRQLLEVMTDLWFNHFNVYARKNPEPLLVGDYLERAIRPHALGRFEDLLIATAQHPAMLVYLDNVRSSANRPRGKRRGGAAKGGINENYARELLELHTLGIGGGYTQRDVIEVAKIFTGWTVADLRRADYRFKFDSKRHDNGSKIVLGEHYAPGGLDEGLALLRFLARQPTTATRIGKEICVRFVADDPPRTCIDGVAGVFLRTGGDIKKMLRFVVGSADFWGEKSRLSKVKSPHEFMISALRVTGAVPRAYRSLSRWSQRMGEPLLLQPVPSGYSDDARSSLSAAGLLSRMNFAIALAGDRLQGVSVDTRQILGAGPDAQLVDRTTRAVLVGAATSATVRAIQERISEEPSPEGKRRVALAMALASPDFQRQ